MCFVCFFCSGKFHLQVCGTTPCLVRGSDVIIKTLEETPLSNMLVIKSMSKSYGVPGVRLGFVYSSNEKMMRFFRKNTSIWNMNSVAEFYMEIILKNKIALSKSFELTRNDRENFIKQLNEIKFISEVYESEANFLLFKLDVNSPEKSLSQYFIENHSIYIKDVSFKFNSKQNTYFRIAVRSVKENNILLNILKNLNEKLV